MKTLLSVLLCFFATNAFASSADSGICPWKLPFTIKIHGMGYLHRYERDVYTHGPEQDADYGTLADTSNFEFRIDTSVLIFNGKSYDSATMVQYSIHSDTLQFLSTYDTIHGATDTVDGVPLLPSRGIGLVIAFAPGRDSIVSLIFEQHDIYMSQQNFGTQLELDRQYSFEIYSALFDDTSIFTSDSAFSQHRLSMTDIETTSFFTEEDHTFGDFSHADFTATSVTLSGIFRPTTFSDPPAIVIETPPQSNLAIYSLNGSIACSFDGSNHAKELEIYSPLGMKVASVAIPPNRNQASLPHLQPGFYFVRLEGDVRKIFVAE